MRETRLLFMSPRSPSLLSSLLLLTLLLPATRAQGQVCNWSDHLSAPPTATVWPLAVAVDPGGDVLNSGWFQYGGDLGGGPVPLNAGGYVAKYSGVDGRYLWSKVLPTNDVAGVATDSSSNVIITGKFMGTVDFGGGPRSSAGANDFYLAKYTKDGSHLWSVRYGGKNDEAPAAIGLDSQGNIFVTGVVVGSTDLGAGPVTGGIYANTFVAHYSGADGHYLWGKVVSGTSSV